MYAEAVAASLACVLAFILGGAFGFRKGVTLRRKALDGMGKGVMAALESMTPERLGPLFLSHAEECDDCGNAVLKCAEEIRKQRAGVPNISNGCINVPLAGPANRQGRKYRITTYDPDKGTFTPQRPSPAACAAAPPAEEQAMLDAANAGDARCGEP